MMTNGGEHRRAYRQKMLAAQEGLAGAGRPERVM
jgi:hypothetical protein